MKCARKHPRSPLALRDRKSRPKNGRHEDKCKLLVRLPPRLGGGRQPALLRLEHADGTPDAYAATAPASKRKKHATDFTGCFMAQSTEHCLTECDNANPKEKPQDPQVGTPLLSISQPEEASLASPA